MHTRNGFTLLIIASGAYIFDSERQVLRTSVSREQRETIGLLLSHGADPNAIDDVYQTPLSLAIYHGWFRTAEILLAAGTCQNCFAGGWTPRMLAAHRCYTYIVGLLLRYGADAYLAEAYGNSVSTIEATQGCSENEIREQIGTSSKSP